MKMILKNTHLFIGSWLLYIKKIIANQNFRSLTIKKSIYLTKIVNKNKIIKKCELYFPIRSALIMIP